MSLMFSCVFITSTGVSERAYQPTKVDSLNKSLHKLNISLDRLEKVIYESN